MYISFCVGTVKFHGNIMLNLRSAKCLRQKKRLGVPDLKQIVQKQTKTLSRCLCTAHGFVVCSVANSQLCKVDRWLLILNVPYMFCLVHVICLFGKKYSFTYLANLREISFSLTISGRKFNNCCK